MKTWAFHRAVILVMIIAIIIIVFEQGCSLNGSRYEVPSWMIRDFSVDHVKGCQQEKLTQVGTCRSTDA